MNRESAKKQFDNMTEELGIEHTFSFDEAWDFVEYKQALAKIKHPDFKQVPKYSKEEFRKGVIKAEKKLKDSPLSRDNPSEYNPVKHYLHSNFYIREIFNPAGELIVTKIHKVAHPFFLLQGTMSIMTEDGEERISAPYYSMTQPGTKRIIYAHTDCILVTVHYTDKTDIDEIEKDVVTENYEDLK
jgi:hypothetical protein